MKRSLILFGIIFLLVACNNKIIYENSVLDTEFPVPKKARIIEEQDDYVQYKWKNANELESIHHDYLQKIKEYGWQEVKEEQMGALRVFTKGGKVIHLTTHNGYFMISL